MYGKKALLWFSSGTFQLNALEEKYCLVFFLIVCKNDCCRLFWERLVNFRCFFWVLMFLLDFVKIFWVQSSFLLLRRSCTKAMFISSQIQSMSWKHKSNLIATHGKTRNCSRSLTDGLSFKADRTGDCILDWQNFVTISNETVFVTYARGRDILPVIQSH